MFSMQLLDVFVVEHVHACDTQMLFDNEGVRCCFSRR